MAAGTRPAQPALAGNLVKCFQPLQIRFALGETLPPARFPHFTQVGKDVEIIPRFIPGSHDALHRHHMLVAVIPVMVRSLRSNEVVAGKTISACFADAVQKHSEITTSSGFCRAD